MRENTRRRLIYIVTTLIVVMGVLLIFSPKTDIVRLAAVISHPDGNGEVSQLDLNIPSDCRLDKIYLRARSGAVPETGLLCTLSINGDALEVRDFGNLPDGGGESKEGFVNKQLPLDMGKLRKQSDLSLTYRDLAPGIKHGDLEVVIEMKGARETVQNWKDLYRLSRVKTADAAAAAPENEKEKAPETTAPGAEKVQ